MSAIVCALIKVYVCVCASDVHKGSVLTHMDTLWNLCAWIAIEEKVCAVVFTNYDNIFKFSVEQN